MFQAQPATVQDDCKAATMSPDILERVNAIVISPETLAACIDSIAKLPDDSLRDFDRRMIALFELLERSHPRRKIALTAIAIDFRMRALSRVLACTFVVDCEVDLTKRHAKISPAAVRVASNEPLLRNELGVAIFDTRSFKARLLN